MRIETREFLSPDDGLLQSIGRLRVEAWDTELPEKSGMECWLDEHDIRARHWLAFFNEELVASARLSVHEELDQVPDSESYEGVFAEPPRGPIASLNRLVVHPSARGLGLSKRLDLMRMEAARAMGCRSLVLGTASGPSRVRQLTGWGFQMMGQGKPFQEPPLCGLPAPCIFLLKL